MRTFTNDERDTTTMPGGTYERMMKANTKEDLGDVIHDLLSDHYPETYYGKHGRQYKYCPICDTTNENSFVDEDGAPLYEGCAVMQTIFNNDLENY